MYCKICKAETDDNAAYCADCKAKLKKRQKVIDNYLPSPDAPPARDHHTSLLVYLAAIIILTSIKIINISISITPTNWGTWMGLVLSIALIGFAIAVFKWKRWGIYGFIATAVTNFIVDMVTRPGLLVDSFYGWVPWLPVDTTTFKAALVIIYVTIIGLFLVLLWIDKSSGWDQRD